MSINKEFNFYKFLLIGGKLLKIINNFKNKKFNSKLGPQRLSHIFQKLGKKTETEINMY